MKKLLIKCTFLSVLIILSITHFLVPNTSVYALPDVVLDIEFTPTDLSTLQVGETFTAVVRASSASAQPVNTIAIYMQFDQNLARINSATVVPPLLTQFPLTVVPLSYDNGNGTIDFVTAANASSQPANFDIFVIEFEMLNNGSFSLTFDQTAQRASGLALDGEPQVAVYNSVNNEPLVITLQQFEARSTPEIWIAVFFLSVSLTIGTLVGNFRQKSRKSK